MDLAECCGVPTFPAFLSAATTFAEAAAKPPRLWVLRLLGESDVKDALDFRVSSKSVSTFKPGPGIIGPGPRGGLDIILSVFGAEPAGDSALAWVSSGFAMLASGDGAALPVGVCCCDCHSIAREWSARCQPAGLAEPDPMVASGSVSTERI